MKKKTELINLIIYIVIKIMENLRKYIIINLNN